jgi:hypothetical protein
MIRIEIYEEVANSTDMVDLLNEIATQVKDGKLEGDACAFKIIGTPETTIE